MINDIHTGPLDPARLPGALIWAGVFLGLAYLAARLVHRWVRRLGSHPQLFVDPTTLRFVGQLLQVGCFLIAGTAYAHLVPALQKLGTGLLASAGVISIVIGFAAQPTLGNLVAGAALLIYRPFSIGDVLMLSAPSGLETATVQDFTLGYTKLLSKDGRWIIIPNSTMASSVIVRLGTAPPPSQVKS